MALLGFHFFNNHYTLDLMATIILTIAAGHMKDEGITTGQVHAPRHTAANQQRQSFLLVIGEGDGHQAVITQGFDILHTGRKAVGITGEARGILPVIRNAEAGISRFLLLLRRLHDHGGSDGQGQNRTTATQYERQL